MAKTMNKASIIAALKAKQAELDQLDDQFMEMDSVMPEGAPTQEFDLLSDKREQLEQEIRSMRERVQLISEWEKFKNGDWSEEIKSELNILDQEFANIADGVEGGMMGEPALPGDIGDNPELPSTPDALATPPIDALSEPSAAEVPPLAPPASPDAMAPPPPTPAAAPIASSKKINYQTQDKKGSSATSTMKGDTIMANQTEKVSLKEKLAEVKTKREAIRKEAQTRVASAWTIAKTMLPTAPAEIQRAFASNLLQSSTKVLTAALRQTAENAHYKKMAETFKEVHGVEMNDPKLAEAPSVLSSAQSEIKSEIHGNPTTASAKKADDRKECGPITGTYDDGRHGSEPKEIDGSKAADRSEAGDKPGETVDVSAGKSAAKKATCSGKDCKGCSADGCKSAKKATTKKADLPPVAPAPAAGAPPVGAPPMDAGAPPMEAEAGADPMPMEPPMDMPPAEEGGANPAGDILTDEKKMVVEEKIDEAQNAIEQLEEEILEEGSEDEEAINEMTEPEGEELESEEVIEETPEGEEVEEEVEEEGDGSESELDLAKVFDEGDMEEKVSSLANEGEKAAGDDDFFAPTSAVEMEAGLDDSGYSNIGDMFSMSGSADPLASLMGSVKTAEQVAGVDVVPSSTGAAAKHFLNDETSGESRDNESDHEGDLFAEAIEAAGEPEQQGAKRVPQDSVAKLEAPKASAKKTATIRRLKPVVATESVNISAALLGNDDE